MPVKGCSDRCALIEIFSKIKHEYRGVTITQNNFSDGGCYRRSLARPNKVVMGVMELMSHPFSSLKSTFSLFSKILPNFETFCYFSKIFELFPHFSKIFVTLSLFIQNFRVMGVIEIYGAQIRDQWVLWRITYRYPLVR